MSERGRADADLCAGCGRQFPPGQLCTACAPAGRLALVLAAYAAALEHIRADHDTLRQLWQEHHRDPRSDHQLWCAGCGALWPCTSARILAGEP